MIAALAALLSGCAGGTKAAESGLQSVDLGSFTSDADGDLTVPFSVPASAQSALLHCGPYGLDRTGQVVSLRDGSGSALPMTGGGIRADAAADHLALLLPVSPDLPLAGGDWEAGLRISGGQLTVSCGLLYRPVAADASGGLPTVDLHVIFVGAEGVVSDLNATGATVNAPFQQAMEELRLRWSPVLALGEVRYSDLYPEDIGLGDGSIRSAEDLALLLRSDPDDGRTLPLFAVPSISLSPDDPGAAGGAPALPQPGTSRSGLALSVAELESDPAGVGRAWAREGLRAMGLFYPVEADGSTEDPLSDTPVCQNDIDGDGLLSAGECAGSGAENLMWWSGGSAATALSGDQAWVVQQSLWVQGG